ncbi:Sulfotransferase family-containing protein [Strongyloides ratti]|uniref:Sulfotransferase family-containing protein n=1 Tax=Strongyloides ratti TaxID=34506 RepID=A0A090N065_STRRB|nr:Sulfotransferase family-containing protein [Strongyloides ratti]CEF70145.1 Sulfotransferase family-containing protein [Strongyloides ratti]
MLISIYLFLKLFFLQLVLCQDFTNNTIKHELDDFRRDIATLRILKKAQAIKCSRKNIKKKCAGIVKLNYQEMYFSPKHMLAACVIQKNFSSMMIAIMCYLFNDKQFLEKHKHLADNEWSNMACRSHNFVRSNENIIKKFAKNNKNYYLKNWISILIVREPIERFISGYMHHCSKELGSYKYTKKCFYCNGNLNCFVKKLYRVTTSNYKTIDNTDLFIKQHFFPQTWRCEYFQYKNFYKILKYDSSNLTSFYESLIKILNNRKISSEKVDYINEEIHTIKSYHATSGKKATIKFTDNLYKNEFILKLLHRIYYPDFKEFKFPIPVVEKI